MSDSGAEGPIWEPPSEPEDPGPRQPQPSQSQPSQPQPSQPQPSQPAPPMSGQPQPSQPAPPMSGQLPYDPPTYDEPRYDQQYFDQRPYDPPPWGEPAADSPPAGAPPFGGPPYGAGDGELPPQDTSNTVKIALFAVLGVLVFVAAIVAAVLLTGDNGKATAKGTSAAAPAPVPSTNDFPSASPTTSDAPSSGAGSSVPVQVAPTVDAGRAVVERYFADINTKDEADAVTLICTDKRAAWRSSIHGPSGDFTVSIAKYVFTSSRPGPNGSLDLTYTVTATKGTASGTRPATFTLVSEIGEPKICGES